MTGDEKQQVGERFLGAHFDGVASPDAQIAIWELPGRCTRFFPDARQAAQYAAELADTHDVYFGVGLYRAGIASGRGAAKDVVSIVALWCDLDYGTERKKQGTPPDEGEARRILGRIPFPPSVVVHSGHGLRCHWPMNEEVTAADGAGTLAERWCKAVQAAAKSVGYSVDSTGDVSRVLRVPGTMNRKDTPVPVTLVEFHPERRYDRQEIEDWIGDAADLPSPELEPIHVEPVANRDEPPKLAVLLANNQRARLAWEHKLDLADTSASAYDLSLASLALAAGWSDQEAAHLLYAHRCKYGDQPGKALRLNYLQRTLARAKREQQSDAAHPLQETAGGDGLNKTDVGNAERLARAHGHELRHTKGDGWRVWDGRRWALDATGEVDRRAVATVRSIYGEAERQTDNAERQALAKHAQRSEQAQRIEAMIKLARVHPQIAIDRGRFDTDPYLYNALDGTIDLRTGELREHRREDLITRVAPIEYDPNARCEAFERFLKHATGGDAELAGFLQRAVGYSLTGDTSEEKLFFVHGPGASGKSTFIEALRAVFGDYASTADFESFLIRYNGGGPRNDIARLAGVRFVSSVEVDDGRKLAEGLIKQLTGGDQITARFLFREAFEFRPAFELWLVANHAPQVRDDDEALWRRILRVPFTHTVPAEKRDPQVKAMLRDPKRSGPAILAWAVRGCLEWQREGLKVPASVIEATKSYRQENDPLSGFLSQCCELRPDASIGMFELRGMYEIWAREEGIKEPLAPRPWGARLRALGRTVDVERVGKTTRKIWRGIGPQPAAEGDADAEAQGMPSVLPALPVLPQFS